MSVYFHLPKITCCIISFTLRHGFTWQVVKEVIVLSRQTTLLILNSLWVFLFFCFRYDCNKVFFFTKVYPYSKNGHELPTLWYLVPRVTISTLGNQTIASSVRIEFGTVLVWNWCRLFVNDYVNCGSANTSKLGYGDEYPTRHNLGISRHSQSMIAYKTSTESFWKFECQICCGIVVNIPYWQ